MLDTTAVILSGPRNLKLGTLGLKEPGATDIVVEVAHSGISTGTEKLFWSGQMPPFPGMGYPLVPGYESAGEIVCAGRQSGFTAGDYVFVPGANCYQDAHGLFGGATRRLISDGSRAVALDRGLGAEAALLALAATAFHAMAGDHDFPELIVGHGVLGRLLARLTVAAGAPPPTVWETNPARRDGARGYQVIAPDTDERRDYAVIYDASGANEILNSLIGHVARGGEIVLAGFYSDDLSFAFPPAFMKEMRLRIAAEWQPSDLTATRALLDTGALSLDGLISHTLPAEDAEEAYPIAFTDPACLKMILDWSGCA